MPTKSKLARAVHANRGVEAAYRKALQSLIAEMHGSVQYWLTAAYRKDPPRIAELAQDATPASKLRRAQESIRATTEAARLIAESSPDEGDNRSAAAMAIVQSEVFELLLKMRESEELDDAMAEPHPNVLKRASSTTPASLIFSWSFITSPHSGAPTSPVPTLASSFGSDPTLRGFS
mgnify:CR=1 FL=1